MKTQPTSRDVARAAGVSQATVSLVLGDKWRGRVSERTAALVRDAARELGYRPNLAARSLRLGRTRTALLVVPALTNEFFARVYTGAARVAAEHDFGVVLYPSPDGVGPARDPFDSARAALDGVIASSMAADALAGIRGTDLPLVMLDSDPAEAGPAARVNLDIADGIRQVTEHLLGLGHRRFAHLASAVDSWTFQVRGRALEDALRRAPDADVLTVPSALTVDAARQAAEHALTRPGARPTALICDDDILAAEPARPPDGSVCASPTTSRWPDSTTSPSPPPSNPNSPPSNCPPSRWASAVWPHCSPSWTAASPKRAICPSPWSCAAPRPRPRPEPGKARAPP